MAHIRSKKKIAVNARKNYDILFALAREAALDGRKDLAKRYVEMARAISQKSRLRIPVKYRRQFCRQCNSFFADSSDVRVRLNDGKIVYLCKNCKHFWRLDLKKK